MKVRLRRRRGFRLEFDASRARVYFLYGYVIVDEMSIGEFKQVFGVRAVRQVIHG